jgi:hypothetical protein
MFGMLTGTAALRQPSTPARHDWPDDAATLLGTSLCLHHLPDTHLSTIFKHFSGDPVSAASLPPFACHSAHLIFTVQLAQRPEVPARYIPTRLVWIRS